MEKVIIRFLKHLQLPIAEAYVQKLLASHPHYPSLLSVTDTLERLGVPCYGARITKEQLPTIAYPYLLPIARNEGETILIRHEADLHTHKEDLAFWNGVIIQAKPDSRLTDPENTKAYSKEKFTHNLTTVGLVALLVVLVSPFFYAFDSMTCLLCLTAACGMGIGYVLLAKDLGIKYDTVEKFCNPRKNLNCDKVLNAAEATLIGTIKLSDAVFIYFSFQWIGLAVLTATSQLAAGLPVLAILSACTLPIVAFSVYYQYVKAKAWCRLCMMVNTVLMVQVGLFGYLAFYTPTLSFEGLTYGLSIVAGALFLGIGAVMLLAKETIHKTRQAQLQEVRALRLKYAPSTFLSYLSNQRQAAYTPFESELYIGKSEAPVQLIMVSNLYCMPCKDQHAKVAQLLATYPDKIGVSIRFILSGKDVEQNPTTTQYLLEYWLQHTKGTPDASIRTEKLMHEWYGMMDLPAFQKKYPIQMTPHSKALESLHYQWTDQEQLMRTPTFFVNGYELPKEYTIQDLLMLTPELASVFSRNREVLA